MTNNRLTFWTAAIVVVLCFTLGRMSTLLWAPPSFFASPPTAVVEDGPQLADYTTTLTEGEVLIDMRLNNQRLEKAGSPWRLTWKKVGP